jgi:hypothetical protein
VSGEFAAIGEGDVVSFWDAPGRFFKVVVIGGELGAVQSYGLDGPYLDDNCTQRWTEQKALKKRLMEGPPKGHV